jgi:hypothetical protein
VKAQPRLPADHRAGHVRDAYRSGMGMWHVLVVRRWVGDEL